MMQNDLFNKLLKQQSGFLKESEKMLGEAMKDLTPEQRVQVRSIKKDIMDGKVGTENIMGVVKKFMKENAS